jgi:hypothetical protein
MEMSCAETRVFHLNRWRNCQKSLNPKRITWYRLQASNSSMVTEINCQILYLLDNQIQEKSTMVLLIKSITRDNSVNWLSSRRMKEFHLPVPSREVDLVTLERDQLMEFLIQEVPS